MKQQASSNVCCLENLYKYSSFQGVLEFWKRTLS